MWHQFVAAMQRTSGTSTERSFGSEPGSSGALRASALRPPVGLRLRVLALVGAALLALTGCVAVVVPDAGVQVVDPAAPAPVTQGQAAAVPVAQSQTAQGQAVTGASQDPASSAAPATSVPAPSTAPSTAPSAAPGQAPLTGASTMQTGLIRMEILPQYDPIPAGAQTELNVLVRLSAGGIATTSRPTLDLAIVLDRSGSMAGDKLKDAKQAGLDLIKRLEPRDRVTLITYDDTVVVNEKLRVMDSAGYDALRSALLKTTEGGSTALGPAMIEALSILEAAPRGDKDIGHILLLSDGLANVGEQRPDVLGARAAQGFSRGVSVSTLGVGLDYNEDLMTKLADQGGGRYHFIKESAAIPNVLTEELAGLASTVAREVVLNLKASPQVLGVTVFGYPSETKDGQTSVRVGSLRAGQVQDIILRLKLDASADPVALGKWEVHFKDTTQDGAPREGALALSVRTSADSMVVRQSEHTEVSVRVAEVESAALLEQAARAVEQRNYNDARKMINSNIQTLRQKAKDTNSKKLEEQAVELEKTLKDVDSAEVNESEQKNFTKANKSKSYKMMK